MSTQADHAELRAPLSKKRVLRAAIDLADDSGIEAVTMRQLGQALGVEAMSLYHHVANKDDVLDGMVDLLVSEIDAPSPGAEWRTAIRQRAISARDLLNRHRWAPRLIASRQHLSPVTLGYMDSVVGDLLGGGFSNELAHHALHVLGSRLLGFNQELFEPSDLGPDVARMAFGEPAHSEYASLAAVVMATSHDDDVEFGFGLDLILDGLARSHRRHGDLPRPGAPRANARRDGSRRRTAS